MATMRYRIALVFSFFFFTSLAAADRAAADDRTICAQRGHEDRIAACSRLIAKSGGRDAVAFDNRGAEYGDKGDYDRAISDFSEAVRIDPKYALAWQHRGAALLRRNEVDRAIADLTQSIRLDANNLNALNDRGMAYAAAGDS